MGQTFDTRTARRVSTEHPGYEITFRDPGSPFRYFPQNLQALGTANPTTKIWDQFEVSWQAPFAGTPTGYTVEWKYETDPWLNPGDVGYTGVTVTGLSHTFTNIDADTKFIDYRVKALYGTDESIYIERPYSAMLFGTFTGSNLYRQGSWVDSRFVMHPENATQWAVTDIANNYAVNFIGDVTGTFSEGDRQFVAGAFFSDNGFAWAPPYRTDYVAKVDPVAGTVTQAVTGIAGGISFKFLGGVATPFDKAVLFQHHSNVGGIGFLNTLTDTLNIVPHGDPANTRIFVAGTYAPNGFVYVSPRDASAVAKCDPVAETVQLLNLPAAVNGFADKFRDADAIGDWVVFAPFDADHVLAIDINDNDTMYTLGDLSAYGNDKYFGLRCVNVFGVNYAFLIPWNAPRCLRVNLDIIKTDPANAVEEIGTLPGTAKFRDTSLVNNKIVSTPNSYPSIICTNTLDSSVQAIANVSVSLRGLSPPAPDTAAIPGFLIGIPYNSPYAVGIHPSKL